MHFLEIGFWFSIACGIYTYVVYPSILALAAKLWRRPQRQDRFHGSVSVIVAALNEEASIARRLDELTGLLADSGLAGEVIVVSDGSTDATVERARGCANESVRIIELVPNVGKSAALTAGCAAARHEVLVFADARQSWAADALALLLENFADPAVGAVSGALRIQSAPGTMAGIGLYWRFETWMKRRESAWHSIVGVSGSISAVRRALFRPIPRGTILDDVYWPLQVAMQGYRVVYDGRACGYDCFPANVRDEFRRKVRTLSGNFQLLTRLPAALLPWQNPIWFQLVSHKVFRLLVPWAMLGLLGTSAVLKGSLARAVFWGQVAFYLVALAGLWRRIGARSRAASAAASLLTLNAAAWLAFWVWISGRTERTWSKAAYEVEAGRLGAGSKRLSIDER